MFCTRAVFSRPLFQPTLSQTWKGSSQIPKSVWSKIKKFQKDFHSPDSSTYNRHIIQRIKDFSDSEPLIQIISSNLLLDKDLEYSYRTYPPRNKYTKTHLGNIYSRAIVENNRNTLESLALYEGTKVKHQSPSSKIVTTAWKVITELNLPKLDIEGVRFSEYSFKAFLQAIIESDKLSSLSLSEVSVDQNPQSEWVYLLMEALQLKNRLTQSVLLKELAIDSCNLETLAAIEIANAISAESLSGLQKLSFHDNMIDLMGAEKILSAVFQNTSDINYINFSANYLDKRDVSLLKYREKNHGDKVRLNLEANDSKWAT
ncbi:MAG: hypothetical protein VX777_03825 [Chlamydiota bacterium]|nr:hypothetical protein [Chlamydiota bacterium]